MQKKSGPADNSQARAEAAAAKREATRILPQDVAQRNPHHATLDAPHGPVALRDRIYRRAYQRAYRHAPVAAAAHEHAAWLADDLATLAARTGERDLAALATEALAFAGRVRSIIAKHANTFLLTTPDAAEGGVAW